MHGYQCPFCGQIMSLTSTTERVWTVSYYGVTYRSPATNGTTVFAAHDGRPKLSITFHACPNDACGKTSVHVTGDEKGEFMSINRPLYPSSSSIAFPEYVPLHVRKDYEEACAILSDSPKASAALSRRCLQGMIRDFWNISKPTLHKEIESLEGKISPKLLKALLDFKSIGNIAAHPSIDTSLIVDIEPDEAEKMIKLIEFLMGDWYIKRYEQECLLDEISNIHSAKQSLKSVQSSETASK